MKNTKKVSKRLLLERETVRTLSALAQTELWHVRGGGTDPPNPPYTIQTSTTKTELGSRGACV
jgi:hypothetical protein